MIFPLPWLRKCPRNHDYFELQRTFFNNLQQTDRERFKTGQNIVCLSLSSQTVVVKWVLRGGQLSAHFSRSKVKRSNEGVFLYHLLNKQYNTCSKHTYLLIRDHIVGGVVWEQGWNQLNDFCLIIDRYISEME